jgi:ribonuclease HI
MAIILYTDGACIGNEQLDAPQRNMRAVACDASGTNLVDLTRSGGSNNIAELWAVELALQWATEKVTKPWRSKPIRQTTWPGFKGGLVRT